MSITLPPAQTTQKPLLYNHSASCSLSFPLLNKLISISFFFCAIFHSPLLLPFILMGDLPPLLNICIFHIQYSFICEIGLAPSLVLIERHAECSCRFLCAKSLLYTAFIGLFDNHMVEATHSFHSQYFVTVNNLYNFVQIHIHIYNLQEFNLFNPVGCYRPFRIGSVG